MTTEEKIQLIKQAIAKAENNQSKLSGEPLELQGFTGYKVKHLLNNLGEIGTTYLEVGVHKLATFVAANFGNNMTSIGVDDFSQFEQGGVSKIAAYKNFDKYIDKTRGKLIEQDCFTLTKKDLPNKIDFYFFDGNHSYESQRDALVKMKSFLADEFLFCVDDWGWEDVKRGTQDGIFGAGYKIAFQSQLGMGKESDGLNFWNGIFVGLLKK